MRQIASVGSVCSQQSHHIASLWITEITFFELTIFFWVYLKGAFIFSVVYQTPYPTLSLQDSVRAVKGKRLINCMYTVAEIIMGGLQELSCCQCRSLQGATGLSVMFLYLGEECTQLPANRQAVCIFCLRVLVDVRSVRNVLPRIDYPFEFTQFLWRPWRMSMLSGILRQKCHSQTQVTVCRSFGFALHAVCPWTWLLESLPVLGMLSDFSPALARAPGVNRRVGSIKTETVCSAQAARPA